MKTIQKTIAFSFFTFIAAGAFAQVNLGLQSTTQAALNATLNTTAITSTTSAVAAATKSTIQATSAKAVNAGTKLATAVDAKGSQLANKVSTTINDVNKSADINAAVGADGSSQLGTNVQDQAGFSSNSSSNANGSVQVSSSKIVDQAKTTATNISSAVENKAAATAQTGKTLKTNTQNQLNADAKAAKETATSVKPTGNATVETGAKAGAKTTVTKQ
jgi:hypothetical protein